MTSPAFRYCYLLAMVITLAGSPSIAQNSGLRGKVEIDGSSTVFPITEAAAAQFNKRYPSVTVNVGVSGTGGGFKRFTKGETDISDASRPIKASEFEATKAANLPFFEIPVAYDGLTLVIHKENDWVDYLTLDEIKKIFTTEGNAKTWSQVRAGWPNTEIQIFAPGTDSGTFDYFKEVVAGKSGSLREDMSTSEDDNVLVTGVSGSPNAIGFFGVAYYTENKDKLNSVPVVNPELSEPVSPTPEAIENGSYSPFSRPLFIYVNAKSFARPEVRQFVGFYLASAAKLAPSTGYVALPSSVYQEARKRCVGRLTGTHYLTKSLEKRSGSVTDVYQTKNLIK
ncbi:MAG: PstS family phosphate ABC transporter substrate-binding protein [Rubripirellula sp.]